MIVFPFFVSLWPTLLFLFGINYGRVIINDKRY